MWPNFGRFQTSTANISGTDKDIQNLYLPQSLRRLAEKVPWTKVHGTCWC